MVNGGAKGDGPGRRKDSGEHSHEGGGKKKAKGLRGRIWSRVFKKGRLFI